MTASTVLTLSSAPRPAATRVALLGVLTANALAAVLLASLLAVLGRATPAGAAPAAAALNMTKFVNTGSGDNNIVYNGDIITYTIVVTNVGDTTITNTNILDILPGDTLDSIECFQQCEPTVQEESIPEPLGGTLIITVTTQLSWTVASLAPGASTELGFRGRVVGQADGTIFNNRAFATYLVNGNPDTPGSPASSETATTVRIKVGENGTPGLSSAPTWFSDDIGGTLSQDWGDFNNDGYLDLVLGSSTGTSVYRNVQGRMVFYWKNTTRTSGVRWADFNGDG